MLFDQTRDHATITAFYALTLSHFDMTFHQHESCEIMYVTKGRCLIETPNEQWLLNEGELAFLDAYVPHRLYVDTKTPCSLLNLEFTLAKTGEIDLTELRQKSSSLQQAHKNKLHSQFLYDNKKLKQPLVQLIEALMKNPKKRLSGEDSLLISLLFQQCLIILGQLLCSSHSTTDSPYLKKAMFYIHARLEEELRIPEIARHVGINKSYLQLLFTKHLHESIAAYIKRKRLEKASFLLVNSSLSVTDVAFQVGYNSRQHFSHSFTQFYGANPRAYREKKQTLDFSIAQGQYQKTDHTWNVASMKLSHSGSFTLNKQ